MRLHGRVMAVSSVVLGLLVCALACRGQALSVDVSVRQSLPLLTAAEDYLLTSINTERAAIGLPPVHSDRSLQSAAYGHAVEMARTSTLSHRLEGEAELSSRGASAGAQFSRITENVAVGPSVVTMQGALMQSQHHRDNILDGQVNSIGIAVVEANGSLWAVEDFSHSVERLSLQEQERRVTDMLRGMQVVAKATPEARATCSLLTGFVGSRPMLTMRYSTGDLAKMPEPLRERMQNSSTRFAGVGACTPPAGGGNFAAYNIAIVVYR